MLAPCPGLYQRSTTDISLTILIDEVRLAVPLDDACFKDLSSLLVEREVRVLLGPLLYKSVECRVLVHHIHNHWHS